MGPKREKRLARQALKHLEFEQKKARQIIEPVAAKIVAESEHGVVVAKSVREQPVRVGDRVMEWSRDEVDIEGSWSWGPRSCLDDAWAELLHPFLVEYAKKTWFQIGAERTKGKRNTRVPKHLAYSIKSICDEAYARLVDLEKDDVDEVFRFRLSGKQRLYGITREHMFMVLWWDPDHNVYPMATN